MAGKTITALRAAGAALILAVAVAACGAPEQRLTDPEPVAPPPTTTIAPDPAAVGANELGVVPILMYHQISANPGGEYDQTPAEFREELERLYREGYRPITVSAYTGLRMDIPAGTHPVVLTFDDSTISQVAFTPDGKPAPETALGILEEFRSRYPDFAPTATFFVNNDPFAGDGRALPWLAAHGYEIGAHTATHANLARLDGTGVQRELVENLRAITAAVPGYTVSSMALPLGVFPTDHTLAQTGSWDGTSYNFSAVMLVGSNPAPSPYSPHDLAAIPRIRSGRGTVDFDSAYWLDRLPEQRYTSDGDPNRISFPRALSGDLAPQWSFRANSY